MRSGSSQASSGVKRWATIIPRCGGAWIGYSLALIGFASLAAYEAYRARIAVDPEGAENFRFARDQRFILSEERTFLRPVVP